MKIDKVMLVLILAFVLVVGLLIYFNTGSRAVITGDAVLVGEDSGETASGTLGLVRKYVPLELSDDDILVSFRIDDITFETKQKPVLENALYLARKYNVTFDLAVIAKTFDEKADPEVGIP